MTRSENQRQAVSIGVCGHLWLNAEERVQVHATAFEALLNWCDQNGTPEKVELLSGLAPGSDLVLTAAVMEFCQAHKISCELRVQMISDVGHLIEKWLQRATELGHGPTDDAQRAVRERMAYWLGRARSVSVISDQQSELISPFQALAAHLAQNSQLLVAVQRPQHPGGPGGTAEIVQWRHQPELIPAALRNQQPPRHAPQSIIINPDSGEVTSVGG